MKTIRFRNTQIDFQEACVHCLGWAHETFPFEQTFFFERRSVKVQILAPLCSEHSRGANRKSQSLQITKYDPFRQVLELTFSNDIAAELARRANLDIVVEDLTGLKRFQVSAHILSHDIRLNTHVKTVVPLDHAPSVPEARKLLEPAIELVMVRNLGKDCFYDVDSVEVQELS